MRRLVSCISLLLACLLLMADGTVIRMEQDHPVGPQTDPPSPVSSSTEAMLEWVYCPGKKTMCQDHNTCCNITATQYGCCPQDNAVCCEDGIHCCSKGFKCIMEKHGVKCMHASTQLLQDEDFYTASHIIQPSREDNLQEDPSTSQLLSMKVQEIEQHDQD